MIFIIKSKPCKWKKPGDLILQRNGIALPSDKTDTPNSPFGASTAPYVNQTVI